MNTNDFLKRALCDTSLSNVEPMSRGAKCSHNSGRWIVQNPGEVLYHFTPSTQMQKDIWLQHARNDKEKQKLLSLLRWQCFSCNNIQDP